MKKDGSRTLRIRQSPAYAVALIGAAAASIECGKLALSFLPNIEVVTLLCGLYGYVFGWIGVAAAAVFVCIEPLLYGFGPWMLSYFLYWPFVSLVFLFLGRVKVRSRLVLTGTAVLLTVWFGVLTSLVDIGLFSGRFDRFFSRFAIYYMRGIPFYAAQIISNAVVFPLAFLFLADRLKHIRHVSK